MSVYAEYRIRQSAVRPCRYQVLTNIGERAETTKIGPMRIGHVLFPGSRTKAFSLIRDDIGEWAGLLLPSPFGYGGRVVTPEIASSPRSSQ